MSFNRTRHPWLSFVAGAGSWVRREGSEAILQPPRTAQRDACSKPLGVSAVSPPHLPHFPDIYPVAARGVRKRRLCIPLKTEENTQTKNPHRTGQYVTAFPSRRSRRDSEGRHLHLISLALAKWPARGRGGGGRKHFCAVVLIK